jgi:RNA polymerase sigma-B factor
VAARCGTTTEKVMEVRAAMHAHFPVSLSRPAQDEDEGERHAAALLCEEPGFARVDAAHDLARLLDPLPARERRILRLRFEAELTQREIAACCGISQMQVSRVIAACLTELADQSRAANRPRPPAYAA